MTEESAAAYRSGLRYLGPRPRSVAELRENLLKKEFSKDTVEKTVALLKEENLLDDSAFAAEFVRSRERRNPKSKRAIKYELFAKGVEESVIEKAVEPLNEYESARKAAEKKTALWDIWTARNSKKKYSIF
jgi:regulatory protein